MEMKLHSVKKVYFYRYNHHIDEDGNDCCYVAVTTDIKEAEELDKQGCRLATISEVNSCIEDLESEYGYIKIIETSDGIFGWMEYGWIDDVDNDDYFCEYVKMRYSMEDEVRGMKEFVGRLRSL